MERIYVYLAVKLIQKSGILKKLKALAEKTKSPVDNKIINDVIRAVDIADLVFVKGKPTEEITANLDAKNEP